MSPAEPDHVLVTIRDVPDDRKKGDLELYLLGTLLEVLGTVDLPGNHVSVCLGCLRVRVAQEAWRQIPEVLPTHQTGRITLRNCDACD